MIAGDVTTDFREYSFLAGDKSFANVPIIIRLLSFVKWLIGLMSLALDMLRTSVSRFASEYTASMLRSTRLVNGVSSHRQFPQIRHALQFSEAVNVARPYVSYGQQRRPAIRCNPAILGTC